MVIAYSILANLPKKLENLQADEGFMTNAFRNSDSAHHLTSFFQGWDFEDSSEGVQGIRGLSLLSSPTTPWFPSRTGVLPKRKEQILSIMYCDCR